MLMKLSEQQGKLPRVIFENYETQIKIGQWLGLRCFSILDSPLRLIGKPVFTAAIKAFVENKFARILKAMGIPEDGTCVILVNPSDSSFTLCFADSSKEGRITLKKGDGRNWNDEITLEYLDTFKTYEYYPEDDMLVESHFAFINRTNGNSCIRAFSEHNCLITLNNANRTFTINIQAPKVKGSVEYPFKFPNENMIYSFLLNLSFPLEIDKTYNEICRIMGFDPSIYPEAVFETHEGNKFESNLIILRDGLLKCFIITKSGWQVQIHQDGHVTATFVSQQDPSLTQETPKEVAIEKAQDFRKELFFHPVDSTEKPNK